MQLAAVGGEDFQQAVLDDDRQTKGHEQGRQQILAQRMIKQKSLQSVTDDRHQRNDHQQRSQRPDAQGLGGDKRQIGRENDEVAMGDVHEAHDAENQRQARREQRVETADQ